MSDTGETRRLLGSASEEPSVEIKEEEEEELDSVAEEQAVDWFCLIPNDNLNDEDYDPEEGEDEDVVMEDKDWDSCSTANTTSADEYSTDNDNASTDGRVLNQVMVGEAIVAAFPYARDCDSIKLKLPYDISDAGSSSGESEVTDTEQANPALSLGEAAIEESFQYSEEISSEEESDSEVDDAVMDDEPILAVLDGIQQADIKSQQQDKEYLESVREVLRVEEALRRIQAELQTAKDWVKETKSLAQKADRAVLIKTDSAGLSRELFAEYKMFCEFLQADHGLGMLEGFSITCTNYHNGSYILYDPALALFKEHVEEDYMNCNWRCEASVVRSYRGEFEHVVEFWPIKLPPIPSDDEQTWGNLFPKLYRMLKKASHNGSSAAKEILHRIPDRKASFAGGWLFDYQFEQLLADKPVTSHRWTLRGSHNVLNTGGMPSAS